MKIKNYEINDKIKKNLIQTLIYFALIMLCEIIINFIFSLFNMKITQDEFLAAKSLSNLIYYMFLTAITVYLEELIFRYLIINKFGKYSKIAIIISAILFAIAHDFSIVTLPFYFITGMLLGLLYKDTKKLQYPMLAHILTNYTIMLIYYIV